MQSEMDLNNLKFTLFNVYSFLQIPWYLQFNLSVTILDLSKKILKILYQTVKTVNTIINLTYFIYVRLIQSLMQSLNILKGEWI